MGIQNSAAVRKNSMVVPQTIENKIMISQFHIQKNWKGLEEISVHHVHSSIIPNSQKVEATQVSIDGCMNKQSMVCIYNGILALERKEILTYTATWMNWRHYAYWNKPVTKGPIPYDSTYMWYLEQSIS